MSAEATVDDIIDDARNFADNSYEEAVDLISSAQSAAGGTVLLDPRRLNFNADNLDELEDQGDPGEFSDGYFPPNTRPEDVENKLETFYVPTIPEFPDEPDELNTDDLFQFDRPVWDVAGFQGTTPPLDLNITVPEAPPLNEYDDPEPLGTLDIRDTPNVTVPLFENTAQMYEPGDVGDYATTYESKVSESIPQFRDWVETYADAWLQKYAPEYDTAMAQLETAISRGYDGNTAMPDDVEQQIFDRAVSRSLDEKAVADAEATMEFAKRGYRVPPVALYGALMQNHQVVARQASQAAREVAIERSRLEHDYVKFVMQVSAGIRDGLRNQVISYSNMLVAINGQVLEHSREIASLMIEAYKLLVDRARLGLEHMRILADIYETEMKSAMADLEVLKVEAEVAKMKKDVEIADVDVWAKKIDAQNLIIDRYRTQLQAVAERAGIEKLKVEIFGEEVSAYNTLVGAKESEFNAYRAAIGGDEAIVGAYTAQVNAYRATVDGKRSQVEAEKSHSDAISDYNKSIVDIFQAELGAYETDVRAEGTRFGNSVDAYRAGLDRYKTKLDADVTELRISYDRNRLELEAAIAQLNGDVRTLLAQGQLLQEKIKLRADTAMAGASAHGSMASSAVSAQNTMVSLVNETLNGG